MVAGQPIIRFCILDLWAVPRPTGDEQNYEDEEQQGGRHPRHPLEPRVAVHGVAVGGRRVGQGGGLSRVEHEGLADALGVSEQLDLQRRALI